jgi:hypothetical protein
MTKSETYLLGVLGWVCPTCFAGGPHSRKEEITCGCGAELVAVCRAPTEIERAFRWLEKRVDAIEQGLIYFDGMLIHPDQVKDMEAKYSLVPISETFEPDQALLHEPEDTIGRSHMCKHCGIIIDEAECPIRLRKALDFSSREASLFRARLALSDKQKAVVEAQLRKLGIEPESC